MGIDIKLASLFNHNFSLLICRWGGIVFAGFVLLGQVS